MRKILGVFEVFLGIFEKTKEKKDRETLHFLWRPSIQREAEVIFWAKIIHLRENLPKFPLEGQCRPKRRLGNNAT